MLKTKQKIAIANLAQTLVMGVRQFLGKGPNTKVRRSKIKWDLDLREGIDFSIWLLGSFEPETVRSYKKIVKAGDVVLDIGANIGAHTLPLAQAVGDHGKVIAFEPTDYAYAKLTQNCLLNPGLAERIHCLQVMLVDSEIAGKSTPGLYSSWPLKEETGQHEQHQGRLMTTVGAEARTLDSVILSLELDRVDFIKLDIDGFECGMMRGASEVLSKWKPTIVMELSPYVLEEQGSSLDELIELLRKHSYALYDLSGKNGISMDFALLHKMIPKGAGINALAIAKK